MWSTTRWIILAIIAVSVVLAESNNHTYPAEAKTIVEFRFNNTYKELIFDRDTLKNMLLHDEVKDRKIVVVSIMGALKKGKSFLLNYFLRYMYTNVRVNTIFYFNWFLPLIRLHFFIKVSITKSSNETIASKSIWWLDWRCRWASRWIQLESGSSTRYNGSGVLEWCISIWKQ